MVPVRMLKHVLVLSALVAGFLSMASLRASDAPYNYDEADYIYAARMGFAANYWDSHAMALSDFIRAGLRQRRDPQAALSEQIRASGDLGLYRHWHGPIYSYWLILASPWAANERLMRELSLIFPILGGITIYAGCLWLSPGLQGILSGIISSSFYLFGTTSVYSTELAPHQAFVCSMVLALVLQAKSIQTHERGYFYAAAVAAGVAFCTLEMALVLLVVLAACMLWQRKDLNVDWPFAIRCALMFAATVLILWPEAVLKLTFVKAYLSLAYLAIFRKGAWGDVTIFDSWVSRVLNSPLEFLLILGAFAVVAVGQKRRPWIYPILACSLLMILATWRVATETPRYSLVFLPTLDLFSGLVWGEILVRRPSALAVGAAACLAVANFGETIYRVTTNAPSPSFAATRQRELLGLIRERHLEQGVLLLPQEDMPTVHCYYPLIEISSYVGETPAQAELVDRKFDEIVFRGFPLRYESSIK